MKIIIINGPNLNLLGTREPEVYGDTTFETYFYHLRNKFPSIQLEYFQSNWEGGIVDKIQETGFTYDGIILNAGGYAHTSVAIADAIAAVKTPVVEVHISNTFAREAFRHTDLITGKCKGMIVGLGLAGYEMAVNFYLAE